MEKEMKKKKEKKERNIKRCEKGHNRALMFYVVAFRRGGALSRFFLLANTRNVRKINRSKRFTGKSGQQ